MTDSYIIYKCKICGKHFILETNDVDHSEKESRFITCPFHGKHKDIIVVGRYEGIAECMSHRSYKRVNRRIKQVRP